MSLVGNGSMKKAKDRVDKNLLSFDIEEQASDSTSKLPDSENEGHKFVKKVAQGFIQEGKLKFEGSIASSLEGRNNDSTKVIERDDLGNSETYKRKSDMPLGQSQPHKPFRIESTPGKGKYVVANKPIKPGCLIFKEKSAVAVLDENSIDKRCFYCFKNSSVGIFSNDHKSSPSCSQLTITHKALPLSRCSKCKTAWYCSKTCQLQDWVNFHKKECNFLSKFNKLPPTSVRLMARILILCQHDYPEFLDAMISNRQLFSSEEIKRFGELSLLLKDFINDSSITAHQLIDLWCKVQCNGFSICDEESFEIGVGLLKEASFFNHSCKPNAVAHFNGLDLEIRVLDEIAIDQEVTIAYIDVFEPCSMRKKSLSSQYFFDCSCEKCNQEEKKPSTGLDYFPCPFCKTPLFFNEVSNSSKSKLSCSCQLNHVFKDLKLALSLFKSINSSNLLKGRERTIERDINTLKDIESTLNKYSVPSVHYFCLKLSYLLIRFEFEKIIHCLASNDFAQADKVYIGLEQNITKYVEDLRGAGATKLHPFISVVYFIQSNACFRIWVFLACIEKDIDPRRKFLEAYSERLLASLNVALYNVSSTHGQQSSTYTQLTQFNLSLSTFLSQK